MIIPKNVSLKEKTELVDAETGMQSLYVRFTKLRNDKAGSRVSARGH